MATQPYGQLGVGQVGAVAIFGKATVPIRQGAIVGAVDLVVLLRKRSIDGEECETVDPLHLLRQ